MPRQQLQKLCAQNVWYMINSNTLYFTKETKQIDTMTKETVVVRQPLNRLQQDNILIIKPKH